MALKKVYVGSFGPHLYDDADDIGDPDGDFSGETQQGFRTDGGGIFDGDFSVGGDLGVTGDASITGALSVTGAITFDGKLSVGLTDWGTGATGILVDGAGYDWAAQFNARVNANLNGCCASGSYSSMALTANQTSHNSFIANWNELYIKTGLVLTDSDNYASVWGNLEIGATVTSPGSDNFIAALFGSLVVGATLTNNTRVCGVYVDSKITSSGYTGSGRTSAFECAIGAGTRAWDYGLYIPASTVTTGIYISAATAITAVGTVGCGAITSTGCMTLTLGAPWILLHDTGTNVGHYILSCDTTESSGYGEFSIWRCTGAAGGCVLGDNPPIMWADSSLNAYFNDIILPPNGAIGVADGNPQIVFDNANNWLEITGKVGIGVAAPTRALSVSAAAVVQALFDGSSAAGSAVDYNCITDAGYVGLRFLENGVQKAFLGYYPAIDRVIITSAAAANPWLSIESNTYVGIGILTGGNAAAKLHIDQFSAAAAVPVLLLDQADVSEQCIKFSSDATDRDINLFTVDVTGAPKMAWLETPDVFSLTKGIAIGDGGTTNYANFAADGELTLFGTARVNRHVDLPAAVLTGPAATLPALDIEGVFVTYDFSKTTEQSLYYTHNVPCRWALTTDVEVHFFWLLDANAADAAKFVRWGVQYKPIADGEAVAGAGTTFTQDVASLDVGNYTAGTLIETTLTTKILGSALAVHDQVGMRFYRDSTNDDYNNDARLVMVHLEFLMDKLGQPTT